jgi:cysteine desulfurase
MAAEVPRMRALRDRLWSALQQVPGLEINGDMERRIANNLNVSVGVAQCDDLIATLTDVAVSSSSACSSGSSAPSHVLEAIGATGTSAIRITVGRFNTQEEIDYAARHLAERIARCRNVTAAA